MKAHELALILQGMPHDTEVKVLGLNGMQRTFIDKVEIRPAAMGLEVVIVVLGAKR